MEATSSSNKRRSISRLLSVDAGNDSTLQTSKDIKQLSTKLQNGGILTANDLFQTSVIDVMLCCDLSLEDVDFLKSSIAKNILISKHLGRASDIYRQYQAKKDVNLRYLSTGSPSFDQHLHGGLSLGTLVEVCGQPGAGKTQFCMTACAQALHRSKFNLPNYGVIYFDTEMKFDAARLAEILSGAESFSLSQALTNDAQYSQLKLQIRRPATCKELLEEIETMQSVVMTEGIVLIVVDSIAALARKEGLNEADKEKYVVRQAAAMKRIAELCNCVVLATNQVIPDNTSSRVGLHAGSNRMAADNNVMNDSIQGSNAEYRPALGPTWHHCITTRFVLTQVDEAEDALADVDIYAAVDDNQSKDRSRRKVHLTKSPYLPNFSLGYQISHRGFEAT